ncbi:MAG: calcium-binding protein, partial [Kordiimonas sp.]
MPTLGNFEWESIVRPVTDGTQLEVGVGRAYGTVQDAAVAANSGDTITVYTDTASQSFVMGEGSIIEVGEGQAYTKLQDAILASSPNDIILVHEGAYYFAGNEYYYSPSNDAPPLISHSLSIIGVGNVEFTAGYVEKGILVTGHGPDDMHLYVENISFKDAYGNGYNSAGIRHQTGMLTVVDSSFEDNEQGILAGTETSLVHVVNSSFSGNGSDGFSHGIYSHSTNLIVEDSNFIDTKHGHHIKSVATGQTIVVNNDLDDGIGSSSYQIDVTGGGDLLVYSNNMTKGMNADNSRFIYYDAYRNGGEPGEVIVENNTISAGTYTEPENLTAVFNETDTIVQFLNNTVTGLTETSLVAGLGHIEGGMLNNTALNTKPYTEGSLTHSNLDDVVVLEATGNTAKHSTLDGNDSVIGSDDANIFFAGIGNDLLVGGTAGDKLLGESGHDTLFGGNGRDVLSGGSGNDLLNGGGGSDRIYGNDGDDTISGGEGQGILLGGAGNDILIGGQAGNERIFGGDGNDTIISGAGRDGIYGNEGIDIAVYKGTYDPSLSASMWTEDWKSAVANSNHDFAIGYSAAWSSNMSVRGISEAGMTEAGNGINYWNNEVFYDDNESFADVEKLQFDNGVYDVATGLFSEGLQLVDANSILLALPSDPMGAEQITGTSGNDLFEVTAFNNFTKYDGLEGNDTLRAMGDDMFIRLSNFAAGDLDTIDAGGNVNVTILSNSGDNTLDFTASTLVGVSKIDLGMGNDTFAGSSANEVIVGGFGDDSLLGGDGDDVFELGLGAGTDYIDGQVGSDELFVLGNVQNIGLANKIVTDSNFDTITRQSDGDLLILAPSGPVNWDFSSILTTNINQIVINFPSNSTVIYKAGNLPNQVIGGDGNDNLSGGNGSDTIIGSGGADTLSGGDGNDVFRVGLDHDNDLYDGGAGTDTITVTADNVVIGLDDFAAGAVETITSDGHAGVTVYV